MLNKLDASARFVVKYQLLNWPGPQLNSAELSSCDSRFQTLQRKDTGKARERQQGELELKKNHWHCIRFLNLIGFMQGISRLGLRSL